MKGTYQFGGRGDEPSGDPVPFVANARFDLAIPPTERSETFTHFDAAAWSLMHPDRVSTIRWQVESRDRDVTLPLVGMRVWDDGRFDVGFYDRIPYLVFSLNLVPPLDP